ncbi:DUF4012 domain-containing protein [Amnibacterium sp. CER49]|uniref:DUF4012 domain-containing protein n=1 Tax=Amnibacterium sp. CER49 TaxID=3039161 RepID=UPI0024497205|nr:DUF4012 domain-containing protein [Amnibacterium sp. CER49]MDH2443068.1 DUF4012 domain-containing protein [Amnibacterium sp. CER49]
MARRAWSRGRRRVALAGWIALGLGVLALVVGALWVGGRVLTVANNLKAAQASLSAFKADVLGTGSTTTAEEYRRVAADTGRARSAAADPVWRLAEHVPWLGPNLTVLRQVSGITDDLVKDGVGPLATDANGLTLATFKPRDGAIDLAAIKRITPAIGTFDAAARRADARLAALDLGPVAAQLRKPVLKLRSELQAITPVTAEVTKVLPVLYPALGGDGPRHYLLLFQNNAEERASGGNPAALAMVDVDHGRITLGQQPNSGSFPEPYKEPVLAFPQSGDWDRIYGQHVTRYLTNITFTPDFPTTAQLAIEMWRRQFGGQVDGVVSIDPVALSYLLKATGPIGIGDKQTLGAKNAVQYLLSTVYAKYPDHVVQDAVFASAAKAVFTAVSHGAGGFGGYAKALKPMIAEQRLKAYSVRSDEEQLLADGRLANMLPADNSAQTVLGVYNNDDATSKMSYYMDATVHVTAKMCPATTPTWTVSTTVTDTLTPAQVATLPKYVLPNRKPIPPGGDRQWVQLYGPAGAKLVSASIDGAPVRWGDSIDAQTNTVTDATGAWLGKPAVQGEMYGRPVGVVSITMAPQQSVTVAAVFSGGTSPSRDIAVSHTPKVHEVPVTIDRTACG